MNEGRFPNKEWFWGIAYTIIPDWCDTYKSEVLENRKKKISHSFQNKKVIQIFHHGLKNYKNSSINQLVSVMLKFSLILFDCV